MAKKEGERMIKYGKIFKVYPETSSEIKAIATFDENFELVGVRLLTKLPRGDYYSVLNAAMFEAENVTMDFQPKE